MFSVSEQVLFGFVLFVKINCSIFTALTKTEGWKTKTIQPKYRSATRVSKYTAFQYLDNHKLTSMRKL